MEDITKHDFEDKKQPENLQPEEVPSYKEAVVNPDKQESESRLGGMKDLFTSILSENRKDYEKQVGEMKNMFTAILEENRKQFQIQLQDMYKALPQIINEADKLRQKEEYIFLNNEQAYEMGQRGGRFTKMNAVKELIVGRDERLLHERVEKMLKEVEEIAQQDKAHVAAAAKDIYERMQRMEQKVMAAIQQMEQELKKASEAENHHLAHKKDAERMLQSNAGQLRGQL